MTRTPDRRLARHVVGRYVEFAQDGSGGGFVVPPNGRVTIIVNLGGLFGQESGAFAAGLADYCVQVDDLGPYSCVQVSLTPLAAYTLLGMPAEELTGRAVDLDDLFGSHLAQDLVERLHAATRFERFDLLDSFLLRRLSTGPRPAPAIEWAWRRLCDSRGVVPIRDLVSETGWSRRHLISRFRQQVGLPPKRVARILRFSHLLGRLRRESHADWARLAFECGYYDQAHLANDFRDLGGTTPTAYLKARQVNSFQDDLERATYDRADS